MYPFGFADVESSLAVMTVIARLPSLLAGAGTVVTAAWTAARLWGQRAGWMAGVATLGMYPLVYYSRTGNVDMLALFFIALAMAVAAVSLREGLTPRRACWFGIWAALATATKDASYAALIAPGIYLAARHLYGFGRRGWREVTVILGWGAGVYSLASGLAFHWGRYVDHLWFITHGPAFGSYFKNPATLQGYANVLGETGVAIAVSLGPPLAVLALVGVVELWRDDRRVLALAAAAPAIIVLIVLPARFVLLRFAMPMTYPLALCGAYALARLAQKTRFVSRRDVRAARSTPRARSFNQCAPCGGAIH